LNLDKQLADFRDMEREDKAFFEDLIAGKEPEMPKEVLNGKARLRLTPDMVVQSEFVSEFFEEDFIHTDDEALLEEMKAHAESLGFDSEKILEALKNSKKEKVRQIKAPGAFPVQPQSQRKEARKRLQEEARRTANLLLNRLGLQYGGRELAYKYVPGLTGTNFVAAVQLINREIDKKLGIKTGERGQLKTEDFLKGLGLLEEVLNQLTRYIKVRMKENE
jgi:hypothetical protein